MAPEETLLTTKAFASRSGLTVEQVTRMLREKKLAGRKQLGRWMISEDQLKAVPAAPQPPPPQAASAAASAQEAPPALTVSEFSARTYLTEVGVVQWLKNGRLQGIRFPGGEWRVAAASLELPFLKHLLRSS
jgi:hypothetical protein